MYEYICVCYTVQLVLQGSVVHVAVDETLGSWSFTEAQQVHDVWMSEPERHHQLVFTVFVFSLSLCVSVIQPDHTLALFR